MAPWDPASAELTTPADKNPTVGLQVSKQTQRASNQCWRRALTCCSKHNAKFIIYLGI